MNADSTMTMEECQRRWLASRQEPATERPTCYNRADFEQTVTSAEFPALAWTTHWRPGCPHWYPGGNAHVLQWCDSRGGRKTRWYACGGCRHKVAQ